jgi:hypothetical protein
VDFLSVLLLLLLLLLDQSACSCNGLHGLPASNLASYAQQRQTITETVSCLLASVTFLHLWPLLC